MKNKEKINYFKILNKSFKIKYGFFSRNGGLSINNFSSLNCSLSSGDKKIIVNKNINLAKKKIKLENTNLKFINQIHGSKISEINKKNLKTKIYADGAITYDKDISLAILTADCAPIFFFDEKKTFICAIHSGWRGCFRNIVNKALKKILKKNKNIEISCIIGPCLEQNNFEVSKSLYNKFKKKDLNYKLFFKPKINSKKFLFDMRALINFQLKKFSLKNIYNIKKDTYKNSNLFFSHRRSNQDYTLPTGRMINIIGFAE